MVPTINPRTCNGCRNCIEICPAEVFQMEGDFAHPVRPADCIECRACVEQCPTQAIELQEDPPSLQQPAFQYPRTPTQQKGPS